MLESDCTNKVAGIAVLATKAAIARSSGRMAVLQQLCRHMGTHRQQQAIMVWKVFQSTRDCPTSLDAI
jgi:hypothetical protein